MYDKQYCFRKLRITYNQNHFHIYADLGKNNPLQRKEYNTDKSYWFIYMTNSYRMEKFHIINVDIKVFIIKFMLRLFSIKKKHSIEQLFCHWGGKEWQVTLGNNRQCRVLRKRVLNSLSLQLITCHWERKLIYNFFLFLWNGNSISMSSGHSYSKRKIRNILWELFVKTNTISKCIFIFYAEKGMYWCFLNSLLRNDYKAQFWKSKK